MKDYKIPKINDVCFIENKNTNGHSYPLNEEFIITAINKIDTSRYPAYIQFDYYLKKDNDKTKKTGNSLFLTDLIILGTMNNIEYIINKKININKQLEILNIELQNIQKKENEFKKYYHIIKDDNIINKTLYIDIIKKFNPKQLKSKVELVKNIYNFYENLLKRI